MKAETSTAYSTTFNTTFSTTHSTTHSITHSTTHNTTHSTTTRKTITYTGKVVLITGGGSRTRDSQYSVEIFLPKSPSQKCILPNLPIPNYGHTLDGDMICGGYGTTNNMNCRQWNSTAGIFSKKPAHNFKPGRMNHMSWSPVSEKVIFLIGAGYSKTGSYNSSHIIKPGVFEGYRGFELKYSLYAACSIPDPETDTLIITGGNNNSPYDRVTSLYNEDGWIEDFGLLNQRRRFHGCASYIADKKRVYKIILPNH